MNRYLLPSSFAGARVGLMGGSFDPAHAGHLHISLQAFKRLGLDYIWWMISPHNPLKLAKPAKMRDRVLWARAVAQHPKIVVTDIEHHLHTRFTIDTLGTLRILYPHIHFTWLMGADNLAQFHHWKNWQDIMNSLPIAVFARPGARLDALNSPAARIYRANRCPPKALSTQTAPAWSFVDIPMHSGSSSAIRACERAR